MPLHTTIHYDGRVGPDGKSPHTGIHARVDSLIEKLSLQPEALALNQEIKPLPQLMPAILQEIKLSRSLIDRTYALEGQLPPSEGTGSAGGAWTPTPEVVAFTTERARAATRFTASLFLSAWHKSAQLKLPPWLDREPNSS